LERRRIREEGRSSGAVDWKKSLTLRIYYLYNFRADQKKALTKTQAAEKAKAKKITQQNKRTQLRKEATMKLIDITARGTTT
jgi:hypothetical protein